MKNISFDSFWGYGFVFFCPFPPQKFFKLGNFFGKPVCLSFSFLLLNLTVDRKEEKKKPPAFSECILIEPINLVLKKENKLPFLRPVLVHVEVCIAAMVCQVSVVETKSVQARSCNCK